MTANRTNSIFYGVDLGTVLLYVLIVIAGWLSITSASYEEGTGDFFSFSHFYMKQLIWVGVAWATAVVLLLLDVRYFHMFAYPAYFIGLGLLVAALLFGREVNGAKAWFEFGSFRVQPVEFAKIATALAVARVMSAYSFSIDRPGNLFKVGMVICIPLFIIILQNDTGSGVVLCSFLFVLYREGLNKWLCIPVLFVAALFILSFLLAPMTLLVLMILVCTLSEAMMNGRWRSRLVFLAALALASGLLYVILSLVAPGAMDLYHCLLTVTLLSLIFVAVYAYRANLRNIFITMGLFVCSMISCRRPTTSSTRFSRSTSATASSASWASSATRAGWTTTSTSRKSPSARAASSARGSSRGRKSSTASCPSAIRTSSSARWARSGASWGRWSC